MVFRWGHSRSRAASFYLKINREVFTWKPQTCLKFRPFKKREARDCESVRARERDFSLTVALSLPRHRTLAFSSLAFFKTSKFQTRLRFYVKKSRFYFKIKGRGSRSRVAPMEHHNFLFFLFHFFFFFTFLCFRVRKNMHYCLASCFHLQCVSVRRGIS